jgi:Tfp pilus assembly protein PilN
MIEINLLPGSAKPRRRLRLPIPTRKPRRAKPAGSPRFDGVRVAIITIVVLVPLIAGWLWLSTGRRLGELDVAIEGATRDSVRYATIIAANRTLEDRQTSVAEKLDIIQDIDQARYVWAHVLDEISRALPQYTWLVNLSDVSPDFGSKRPRVRIEGRAGHTFAMTQLMQNLEASPFLSAVTLVNHLQVQEDGRPAYQFVLELSYRDPPPDAIRTVPLFIDLERD